MILGIDIGTTTTKGAIVNYDGALLSSVSIPTPRPISSRLGVYEHNATVHWWENLCCLMRALGGVAPNLLRNVEWVSISALWPTFLPADESGTALCNALLYNDKRAASILEELDPNQTHFPEGYEWPPRILWLKRHLPHIWQQAKKYFTAHSYLTFRLTGNYVVDHHTAQALGFQYSPLSNKWNNAVVEEFGLSNELLPSVSAPSEVAGYLKKEVATLLGLREGIPVLVGTGDTFASMLSAGLVDAHDVMLYYGTVGLIVSLKSECSKSVLENTGTYDTENIKWLGSMPWLGRRFEWAAELLGFKNIDAALTASPIESGHDLAVGFEVLRDSNHRAFLMSEELSITGMDYTSRSSDVFASVVLYTAHVVADILKYMPSRQRRLLSAGGLTQNRRFLQLISEISGTQQLVCNDCCSAIGTAFFVFDGRRARMLSSIQEERIAKATVISATLP